MEIKSVWILTVRNTFKGDEDIDITVYRDYDKALEDYEEAARDVLFEAFRFDDAIIDGESKWIEAFCKADRRKYCFSAELEKRELKEDSDVLFNIQG